MDVRTPVLLPGPPAHCRSRRHPGACWPWIDLALRWEDIASVARQLRVDEPKSPKIIETDESRTLVLRINNETNLEIEFERPCVIRLPGHGATGGEQQITALRIWVDEPLGFMDEVGKHL